MFLPKNLLPFVPWRFVSSHYVAGGWLQVDQWKMHVLHQQRRLLKLLVSEFGINCVTYLVQSKNLGPLLQCLGDQLQLNANIAYTHLHLWWHLSVKGVLRGRYWYYQWEQHLMRLKQPILISAEFWARIRKEVIILMTYLFSSSIWCIHIVRGCCSIFCIGFLPALDYHSFYCINLWCC